MDQEKKEELQKRISFFDYKGYRILYENYSDLNSEEALVARRMATEEIIKHEPRSVLTVINVKNLQYGNNVLETIEKTKKLVKEEEPFVIKTTVIGIESSVYNVVINLFASYAHRDFKAFKTIEKAKEWLTGDE